MDCLSFSLYLTLELLRANGIAPRASVVHVPRQIEPKVEINSEEDAQIPEDILAKERALLVRNKRCSQWSSFCNIFWPQAELEQVRIAKRAAVAKDKQLKDRIKSEIPHFTPGEIIDLTLWSSLLQAT